jgi:hypothetical protein
MQSTDLTTSINLLKIEIPLLIVDMANVDDMPGVFTLNSICRQLEQTEEYRVCARQCCNEIREIRRLNANSSKSLMQKSKEMQEAVRKIIHNSEELKAEIKRIIELKNVVPEIIWHSVKVAVGLGFFIVTPVIGIFILKNAKFVQYLSHSLKLGLGIPFIILPVVIGILLLRNYGKTVLKLQDEPEAPSTTLDHEKKHDDLGVEQNDPNIEQGNPSTEQVFG